jgi:hypothetical protein
VEGFAKGSKFPCTLYFPNFTGYLLDDWDSVAGRGRLFLVTTKRLALETTHLPIYCALWVLQPEPELSTYLKIATVENVCKHMCPYLCGFLLRHKDFTYNSIYT